MDLNEKFNLQQNKKNLLKNLWDLLDKKIQMLSHLILKVLKILKVKVKKVTRKTNNHRKIHLAQFLLLKILIHKKMSKNPKKWRDNRNP